MSDQTFPSTLALSEATLPVATGVEPAFATRSETRAAAPGGRLLSRLALVLPVAVLSLAAPGGVRRSGTPTLQFQPQPGYAQGIGGDGWPSTAPLTVSVTQGSTVSGLELSTSEFGSFTVGVRTIDVCLGEIYAVRDFQGDRLTLKGPKTCKATKTPPVPSLIVTGGTELGFHVTHVDSPPKKRVSFKVGDAVLVWEPGTGNAEFQPAALSSYLELVDRGVTKKQTCSAAECAAGFFWEWVGMKRGKTAIKMTPSCSPKCKTASYWVPLTINRP